MMVPLIFFLALSASCLIAQESQTLPSWHKTVYPENNEEQFEVDDSIKTVLFARPLTELQNSFSDRQIRIALQKFENTKYIYIFGPTDPISEETASVIANFKDLKGISFANVKLNPEALEKILRLPLEKVVMCEIPIGRSIKHLNTSKLKRLHLYNCGLENSSGTHISKAKPLSNLNLSYNEAIDSELIFLLSELKALQELDVTANFEVDDKATETLLRLPKLRQFTCRNIADRNEKKLRKSGVDVAISRGFMARNMGLDDRKEFEKRKE